MAEKTNKNLRKLLVYQVYLRNHTESGTINEFIDDLDRIKDLGVDIVYLMPINPIGIKKKKGSLGCPYSIRDYYDINSEYGTIQDFELLIEEVHKRSMKLMIDIVLNHTSHDTELLKTNPEYYYYKDGKLSNKVGDWWDITDLDYSNKELWLVQIEMLKYWVKLGVDGFRADVASMIPVDFWIMARKEISGINPDFIWLAESIHLSFIQYLKKNQIYAASDSELYEAFDIEYTYDFWDEQVGFFEKGKLAEWVKTLNYQEGMYPDNFVKLRNLENHDQPRIASYNINIESATAFIFFQKGATMIYAGQEAIDDNTPSLFDIDKVNWDKGNISNLIKKLSNMKKNDIFATGTFHAETKGKLVIANYDEVVYGYFNFGKKRKVKIVPGIYYDLVNDTNVELGSKTLIKDYLIIRRI